jgi:hypothetical protein
MWIDEETRQSSEVRSQKVETEEYRGIRFQLSSKGHWYFISLLPPISAAWMHWSRFFTQTEHTALSEGTIPYTEQVMIMRSAIDRALAGWPIYTKDIRDQTIFRSKETKDGSN